MLRGQPRGLQRPHLIRLLVLTCLLWLGGGPVWGQQQIVIAEEQSPLQRSLPPELSAPFANAICALYRESTDTRRTCRTATIATDDEAWLKRLRDGDIQIAIVSRAARKRAWDAQQLPARGLRSLFVLNDEKDDKALVSSTAVSNPIIAETMNLILDNLYRLQVLYVAAAVMQSNNREGWIDAPTQRMVPPLHPGAWGAFQRRGWLPPPFWIVLGSFKQRAEADRVADVLAQKYAEQFPRGLQVRLSNNDYFALIAGAADDERGAGRSLRALQDAIREIPNDAYLYPALRGWGPDLLY